VACDCQPNYGIDYDVGIGLKSDDVNDDD
jgi:hypothetical protein